MNTDTSLLSQCWVKKGTCCWCQKIDQNYCQQTIRQQETHQNWIILLNIECRYKSAESMLSRKRGYKVDFISTYLWLVVDAKKLINVIANRLLNNKRPNQNYTFSLNIECRYKSAESMLSQKRGYKLNFISTHLGLLPTDY